MKENTFETNTVPASSANISNLIRGMTVEQLLVAGQLADRVKMKWNKRYLGALDLHIIVEKNTLGGGRHFDVLVDEALQIYEFPQEARDLLIELLIKDQCK